MNNYSSKDFELEHTMYNIVVYPGLNLKENTKLNIEIEAHFEY